MTRHVHLHVAKHDVHGKHKVHMNYLEKCRSRYLSNPLMGRTHTHGPDEFEPLKFDCTHMHEDESYQDYSRIQD